MAATEEVIPTATYPTATYYSTHFQIHEGVQYKVYTFCSESTDYFFMSDHKDLICFQSNSQNIEELEELESHTILGIETSPPIFGIETIPGKWIIKYESTGVTLTIPDNQDVVTYFRGVDRFFNFDMHEPLAPRIRF